MQVGDKVKTVRGDIDRSNHVGECGTLQGFARLSPHHPREARVVFEDGRAAWFWLSDVQPLHA